MVTSLHRASFTMFLNSQLVWAVTLCNPKTTCWICYRDTRFKPPFSPIEKDATCQCHVSYRRKICIDAHMEPRLAQVLHLWGIKNNSHFLTSELFAELSKLTDSWDKPSVHKHQTSTLFLRTSSKQNNALPHFLKQSKLSEENYALQVNHCMYSWHW